ncbi:pre-mRNA-processing factor 39-2-like [Quercus robur]|uniref:pre-mRNA-processing factor 39-2-like n=1 Tax=Quercus robur TaxID=38942 RepID=UPI0021626E76|nr:pre-mRNA-processing factor 39-2-like [Quercus robur]
MEEVVLIRKVSTNLPEIVDMVMPTVLLVIIMIASHFLYFAPIPWPLIRWAAALVLCIIFIVRAHIQNRWLEGVVWCGCHLPTLILKSTFCNLNKDDIKKICLVYDSFLSEFPLCYGYWRKYADHKTRLCTVDKVVEIFERAVQSATYSVGVWVDYCTFSMSVFEDSSDIRRLFQRGISFVGKDYMCHTLWDKYIEFELSQQQWSSLTHIYTKALRFPTKKLRHYYNCFKKLVAFWEEEIKCQSISATEKLQKEPVLESKEPICFRDDEISCIIKDLLDPSAGFARSKALQKYLSVGEWFYKEARHQLDDQICHFEANIHRSYFHVRPLDSSQLENWHNYLDFVEMHGDFDWAVKLYEGCLIPCANYLEFWMHYVEFMESKGGREITNNALDRSTLIFLKRVPVVHLFKSRFKEQIGDVCGA